jgi:glycerol-3-phosphate dehydrogenase
VRPVPILYPLRQPFVERAYVGAGVALYDALAFSTGAGFGRDGLARRGGLPWHRHLSKRRALELAPGLRRDALVGAVVYYDCQVDDARFVVELVRTAASYGAVVLSRAPVVGFLHEGGRVAGVSVRDSETGRNLEARAKVTISATGPWTEDTEALAGHARGVTVRPSKGVHVLVPRSRLDAGCGLILRTKKSVLFVLPWRDSHWIVGTTDTDWPYSKGRPLATSADVDYILSELNSVLEHPLGTDDVVGVYAGLRPLVAGKGVVRGPGEGRRGSPAMDGGAGVGTSDGAGEPGKVGGEETTKISREHAVGRPAPGLVVISGGKYTTYRVMAADAVNAAVAEAGLHALECRTASVPLLGARGLQRVIDNREALARESGITPETMERLLGRYGSLVTEVLASIRDVPSLSAPLEGGHGYLRAEVAHAVSHEGARHLDDVLSRRARLAIESPDRGTRCAREAGEIMAGLLGWDQSDLGAELDAYARDAELWAKAAREAHDDAEAAHMAEGAPPLSVP